MEKLMNLVEDAGIILAQQSRIAELRTALSKYLNVMYEEDYAAKVLFVELTIYPPSSS